MSERATANKCLGLILSLCMAITLLGIHPTVVDAQSLPDLTVTSVNAPTSTQVGGYIAVSWSVRNLGTTASTAFYNRISLATTPYGTDYSLGNYAMSSIPAGGAAADAQVPQIPSTVPPGTYYVTVYADGFQTVTESNENNNINKAANLLTVTGTVVIPSVETRSASSVAQTSAVLNGYIDNDGGSSITQQGFSWGTTSACASGSVLATGVSGSAFSYYLPGLSPTTTYYFKAWATNSAGQGTGSVVSFVTQNPTNVVDYIVLSPNVSTIAAGAPQSYSVEAFNMYGVSLGNVTSSSSFSISAGAGGYWASNTYYSQNSGQWVVQAMYSGISSTAVLTVTAVTNTSSIAGYVYDDANQNGVRDEAEAGIAGVVIVLNGSTTTITAQDGSYSFQNLASGQYSVTEITPTGYSSSTTDPVVVAVGSSSTSIVNFGIYPVPSEAYSSLDYFTYTPGFGIKYRVTDNNSLDVNVWAVSQSCASGMPDNLDFVYTLVKEGTAGGYYRNSTIGGQITRNVDGKDLTTFYAGFPVGNQANFYFEFSLPRFFNSGDQWTVGSKAYQVSYVGSQTIGSVTFPECLKVIIDDTQDPDSYLAGTGYYILAKGVGIVQIVFTRKVDDSVVEYDYLAQSQFTSHWFGGMVLYNGTIVQGISVQIANADWDTRSTTPIGGRFLIQAYGPDVVLRLGYDENNDYVFDFSSWAPEEFVVNNVDADVLYIQVPLQKPPLQGAGTVITRAWTSNVTRGDEVTNFSSAAPTVYVNYNYTNAVGSVQTTTFYSGTQVLGSYDHVSQYSSGTGTWDLQYPGQSSWPAGAYRADLSINGVVLVSIYWTVAAPMPSITHAWTSTVARGAGVTSFPSETQLVYVNFSFSCMVGSVQKILIYNSANQLIAWSEHSAAYSTGIGTWNFMYPTQATWPAGSYRAELYINDILLANVAWTIGTEQKITGTFYYGDNGSNSKYFYDDSYFFGDSHIYSASLATMSLCLAMSASSANITDSSTNTTDWNKASDNVKDLLTQIGFTDFSTNPGFQAPPTNNSIGVAVAKKILSVNGKPYTLIAVAIRGGGYGQEWAGNFEMGASGQHEGFGEARDEVLTYLQQYCANISGDVKLWITGYSRGAAVANLVAGAIDHNASLGNNLSLERSDMFAYTFETPMGTLSALATNPVDGTPLSMYLNIFNIVNPADIVTKVAPSEFGFSRYGKDKVITGPGDENYSVLDPLMEKQLAYVTANPYLIDSFAMQKFILGDGFIAPDANNKTTQQYFLDDLIAKLSQELFVSRENYVTSFQDIITETIGFYYGYSGDPSNWKVFQKALKERFTSASDWGVLIAAYLYDLPGYPATTRLLEQWVIDSLNEAGITSYDSNLIHELAAAVANKVLSVLPSLKDESVTAVANFQSIASAHHMELCLAWLRLADPNYVTIPQDIFAVGNGSYLELLVNCPVDVSVYDSTGAIASSIIADTPMNVTGSDVTAAVNSDGEKVVYLPVNSPFAVKLVPTRSCNVTYSIDEFSFQAGQITRVLTYYDVPAAAGDTLVGTIPGYSAADLASGTPNGSSTAYSLVALGNRVIPPSEDLKGASAEEAYFTINVTSNNETWGYVTGQGMRLLGHFAQVTATPFDGYVFDGWYENGTEISADPEYRFAVRSNVNLVAQFIAKSVTTAASDANPSVIGQPVMFTASVTPLVSAISIPTGNITFSDNGTILAQVALNASGNATLTTSKLTTGSHIITATYSGDAIFAGSSANLTQIVEYGFSGFLPPLGKTAYNLGSTLPIEWQLTDFNGSFIDNLNTVRSLLVGPSGGTLVPPKASGNSALRYDSTNNQYIFNWKTIRLSAGNYTISLTLSDGTSHTVEVILR